MTYPCPKCKRPFLTEAEAAAHCATRTCPECYGKGIIVGGILEPNKTCPKCAGSGRV